MIALNTFQTSRAHHGLSRLSRRLGCKPPRFPEPFGNLESQYSVCAFGAVTNWEKQRPDHKSVFSGLSRIFQCGVKLHAFAFQETVEHQECQIPLIFLFHNFVLHTEKS